ncbi:hypothetical protein D3C85_1165750 [compost metagenome]
MKIIVNLYDFEFHVEIIDYTPAVAGSYSFTASSDSEYYGADAELDFKIVTTLHHGKEVSKIVLDSLTDTLYTDIYNAVLEAVSGTNSDV